MLLGVGERDTVRRLRCSLVRLGKAGLKRLDTFTILKADASSGWYPSDENYAPANLSIAQGSLF
jgi:hypothetical protein